MKDNQIYPDSSHNIFPATSTSIAFIFTSIFRMYEEYWLFLLLFEILLIRYAYELIDSVVIVITDIS